MTFELSTLVTDFFVVHLAAERNASQHTVYAYRDTMKLLLRFAAADRKRTIDRLTLEDLSAEVVLRFLSDLESRRRNSIRGGPHRLDHLAAFLRWTPQFLLPPVREILRGGEPEGKVPLRMFFQASVHLLRRRPSVRRVRSLAVV